MSTGRVIANTKDLTTCDWPDGWYLQGGYKGRVFARGSGESYTTPAFFEVFPPNSFVRGEGATMQEAERKAWDKCQRYATCIAVNGTHEYDPRGYTNGAGFCVHCGFFRSQVFTAEDLGLKCATCGIWANYGSKGELFYCEEHYPHSDFEKELLADEDGSAEMSQEEFNDALTTVLTRLASRGDASPQASGDAGR